MSLKREGGSYEPDMNRMHQDRSEPRPADPAGCPELFCCEQEPADGRGEGAKELLMRPAGILSLFSLAVTSLKERFIISLCFPVAPLRAPRNKTAEFRNACVPATHRHRKDARTHSHARTDDSCITAAWRRLITASFVRVT